MNFNMYIPILVVVVSNTIYHICSKSTPEGVNVFASLTLTYLIAGVASAVLYFVTERGGNLLAEYKSTNWASIVLGFAIIGLECGNIYMYKVGWNISTGQLVQAAILAVVLVIVGALMYSEQITLTKAAGIIVCLGGLYLINK